MLRYRLRRQQAKRPTGSDGLKTAFNDKTKLTRHFLSSSVAHFKKFNLETHYVKFAKRTVHGPDETDSHNYDYAVLNARHSFNTPRTICVCTTGNTHCCNQ